MTGLQDRTCRDKILDVGWMLNRQRAKPLDELQKMAEYAKRNEDASRAISKTTLGNVSVFDSEEATIAPFIAKRDTGTRSSTPSSQSGSSLDSKKSDFMVIGTSSEYKECFYCKKKHKGGWAKCTVRLKEDPGWRPGKKDFR